MSHPQVYLVSHGEYSDYGVECAFTTRELAVEYAAKMNKASVDEMTEAERIDDLPYLEFMAARRNASENVTRLLKGSRFFVEEYDLYDSVPVIAT